MSTEDRLVERIGRLCEERDELLALLREVDVLAALGSPYSKTWMALVPSTWEVRADALLARVDGETGGEK